MARTRRMRGGARLIPSPSGSVVIRPITALINAVKVPPIPGIPMPPMWAGKAAVQKLLTISTPSELLTVEDVEKRKNDIANALKTEVYTPPSKPGVTIPLRFGSGMRIDGVLKRLSQVAATVTPENYDAAVQAYEARKKIIETHKENLQQFADQLVEYERNALKRQIELHTSSISRIEQALEKAKSNSSGFFNNSDMNNSGKQEYITSMESTLEKTKKNLSDAQASLDSFQADSSKVLERETARLHADLRINSSRISATNLAKTKSLANRTLVTQMINELTTLKQNLEERSIALDERKSELEAEAAAQAGTEAATEVITSDNSVPQAGGGRKTRKSIGVRVKALVRKKLKTLRRRGVRRH